jgi:hypothetical protein
VNDQSVAIANSIRPVCLASLLSTGEARTWGVDAKKALPTTRPTGSPKR